MVPKGKTIRKNRPGTNLHRSSSTYLCSKVTRSSLMLSLLLESIHAVLFSLIFLPNFCLTCLAVSLLWFVLSTLGRRNDFFLCTVGFYELEVCSAHSLSVQDCLDLKVEVQVNKCGNRRYYIKV